MDRPVATLPLFPASSSEGFTLLPRRRRGLARKSRSSAGIVDVLRRHVHAVATSTLLPYQNTRFQTRIAEAGARLSEWTLNPWRKLSLLVLTFLLSFLIGVGLGSITGALDLLDLVAAMLSVLVLEVSVRGRGVLRRAKGDRLPLHLTDMARMGLLYGLLLEGFKLL
jgi:hypothetical protein